jgi:hypothetical protein
MKNIVSVDLRGGLGNMLFQISTGYAVSLKNNMDLIVDLTYYHGGHYHIGKYLPNILRNIKFSQSHLLYPCIWETAFHYQEIPVCNGNTKLNGYFQSEKYFVSHRKEIIELFKPDEITNEKIKTKYSKILEENNTCSIHVRRGDYLGLPNHFQTLTEEYYMKSSNPFNKDDLFLIFSDDISWCQKNFDFIKNKIFITDLEDYEEIYLMSLCNNNIIANSSFSWWGAWLNENNDKIIISPKKWFGPAFQTNNTKDLIPENWISID